MDEQDWVPGVIFPRDRQVFIRIGYGEAELREKVKQAGGCLLTTYYGWAWKGGLLMRSWISNGHIWMPSR